jgi:rifampicin phosphotransferase
MHQIISDVKNDSCPDQHIGNKAMTLIELKNFGFNVPDFFVISSDVYDIISVQENIFKAYENLGSGFVAVRSSAVGEDGLKKSFAGQYKSVLNVSKGNLINAIKECLESLSATHALSYARGKATDKMAVIVQTMIFPEISGVAFSADPVRNDRSKIIIEYTNGQCEALVSGAISPNHNVFSKDGDYGENIPENIKNVAQITKEIENKLGYFVDVEWAIYNNELFILQARPITTLI